MSFLNAAICKTIRYTLWVEWYYLKKTIIWPWDINADVNYTAFCLFIYIMKYNNDIVSLF